MRDKRSIREKRVYAIQSHSLGISTPINGAIWANWRVSRWREYKIAPPYTRMDCLACCVCVRQNQQCDFGQLIQEWKESIECKQEGEPLDARSTFRGFRLSTCIHISSLHYTQSIHFSVQKSSLRIFSQIIYGWQCERKYLRVGSFGNASVMKKEHNLREPFPFPPLFPSSI